MRCKLVFFLFVIFVLIFAARMPGDIFEVLPQAQKGIVISPTSNSLISCSTVFPFRQDEKFTYFLSCAHGFNQLSTMLEDRIPAIIGLSPLVVRHCQVHKIGECGVLPSARDYVVLKAPKMSYDKPFKLKAGLTNTDLLNKRFKVLAGEYGRRVKIYDIRAIMHDATHIMFEPPLDPGASGSPVLNDKNEVVGMVEGITKCCGVAIRIDALPLDKIGDTPAITDIPVIPR